MAEKYGLVDEAVSRSSTAFSEHLQDLRGQVVDASTWAGTVQGTLLEVSPDHILIQTPTSRYHVRSAAIAFVRTLL